MYKGDNKMSFDINLRDVKILREDACKPSSRRFISRSQLTTSDEYITLKDLPHSIASRLIAHVPIKVLNTDWADVGIMEYDLLDSLYSDENITHTEPVANHEEAPEASEKNAEVEDVVEEDVEEAEAPVEETVAEEAPVEEESSEEVVEDKKSEEEASVEESIRAAVANKKYNNKFKRKK